jgi:hypothetical protein
MVAVPSIFIFLNLSSSLGLKRNKAAQWYTVVIFLKVLRWNICNVCHYPFDTVKKRLVYGSDQIMILFLRIVSVLR